MKVVVFGATGRTGQAVVQQALDRRQEVVAAARSADSRPWPPGVTPVATDITSPGDVERAMQDVDRAVLAVGVGATRAPTDVYSRGVHNVLAALGQGTGVRLSVVSALPAAPTSELSATLRVGAAALSLFFGATYADMRRMEEQLFGSDIDWVCPRPPRLVNGPVRSDYAISDRVAGRSISHADLALALLDVLDDPGRLRRSWFVSGMC